MKSFAEAEWDRAQRALASAASLVEVDPDSSVSRAYYAVFHAASAFFALRGQTFTKHSALRAALHRELIQRGGLDRELGKVFDFLLDLRETGDYGGVTFVAAEDARVAASKAQVFLAALLRLCPELGPE